MFPASTLLDAHLSPFILGQSSVLGHTLGVVLGEDHVAVLELAVLVLIRVVNL